MLLYPLYAKAIRCWCLDLTATPGAPGPSVYALVVPAPAPAIYIGATRNFAQRIRQHLSRARSAGRGMPPKSAAAAVLRPVITGRSGLLVLRLETAPPDDHDALQRLELAWLIVAAREEVSLRRRRGPRLQWSGDPAELRTAFRLARHRRWPGCWIRALRPLCDNRALPERWPRRQARSRARAPGAARPVAPGPAGRAPGGVPLTETGPARPAFCTDDANRATSAGAGGPASKIGSQRQNRGRSGKTGARGRRTAWPGRN